MGLGWMVIGRALWKASLCYDKDDWKLLLPAGLMCCSIHRRRLDPSYKRRIIMPLVSMRQLLDEAAKGGYGVGAFNVNDMEQIQAIMMAAKETKSPVIVQASRGARAFPEGI